MTGKQWYSEKCEEWFHQDELPPNDKIKEEADWLQKIVQCI